MMCGVGSRDFAVSDRRWLVVVSRQLAPAAVTLGCGGEPVPGAAMRAKRGGVEFVDRISAHGIQRSQCPVEGPARTGGLMRRRPSERRGGRIEADFAVP